MKNLVLRNRIKALVLTGIIFIGGSSLTACSKNKEDSSYSASMNYSDFDELLKSLPEGIKKENLQTIYNVLYHLNGEVANSVKVEEDNDKLFQMDWDTIQALALASNDYTSQEMIDMFDTFEYDAEYLYELYKNFASIFIPFGERITSSTGLVSLIKDEKQRGDFLKYENILIDINVARNKENDEKLEELYQTALAYIRSDFLSNRGGSDFTNEVTDPDKITGYSALMVPYVNTIIELSRNSEFKLSDDEIKELNSNGICNTALASIEDNLEGYYRKIDSLSENEEIENEGAYEKARNLAIDSLTKASLYFIDYEHATLSILTAEPLLYNTIETTNKHSNAAPKSNTTTQNQKRSYDNLDDLKNNENKDVVKKAEQGKKKVDNEIEKENQQNKEKAQQEAQSKADKESSENQKESDEKMNNIKDNANVKDPNGDVNNDKEIVQPSNPNEAIGGVNEDREFDGPGYDADGNIIVKGAINVLSFLKPKLNNIKVLIKKR